MENQFTTTVKNGDPTIHDVLRAIQSFSGDMDKKFEELQQEMRNGFARVDRRFDSIEARLDRVENELIDIKASIEKLEKRTREDSDAGAKDFLTLKNRVAKLEQQLQALQMKQMNAA